MLTARCERSDCRKRMALEPFSSVKCLVIGMLECICSTECYIYANFAKIALSADQFRYRRKPTSIHVRLNIKSLMKEQKGEFDNIDCGFMEDQNSNKSTFKYKLELFNIPVKT